MDLSRTVEEAYAGKVCRYEILLDSNTLGDDRSAAWIVIYGLAGVDLADSNAPAFRLYDPLPGEAAPLVTILSQDGARLAIDRQDDSGLATDNFSITESSVTGATLRSQISFAGDQTDFRAENAMINAILNWAVLHVADEKMAAFDAMVSSLQSYVDATRAARLGENAAVLRDPAGIMVQQPLVPAA